MKKIQDRNKSLKTNASRRLASYLSAGVCVAGAEARAALQVTFTAPAGLDIQQGYIDYYSSADSYFAYNRISNVMFTRGAPAGDHSPGMVMTSYGKNVFNYNGFGTFADPGEGFYYGAQQGSSNYANISFTHGTPLTGNTFEAVGQFNLNLDGTGTLIALAWNDDDSSLSISAGKTAIDNAAVPEPSSALLMLLAVGTTACARRRRNAVRR